VDKVSYKAITYSEDFKVHFMMEYASGKLPTQIFQEAGFDTRMLGKQRVDEFARRMRKMSERPEGFVDLRSQNSGRPRTKNRTSEEEIAYLKHQVALQKQQIEALKKTNFIHRKAAKVSHKKNINSSKH
ncbi:HTH domain-containing protein, partial [Virgibacillus sp. MSJ-26]|uniref:HTH domain-containing protein n=1 Tax=Virgibacillus sp. MSJ-26 TaxID=2841522 RepID=UPI00352FF33E